MVSVLLVSNQAVVAEGLRTMLETSDKARLTATAPSLMDAIQAVPDGSELVVLLDLDSTWKLNQLRDACRRPGIRVCLYANSISPEVFFQTREVGLAGIISTRRPASEVTEAVCGIAEGQFYYDPQFTGFGVPARAIHLSPREGRLIELLTQGLKNKEIAYLLGITEGTVKVYLSKLYQKVGAKDRFDLALSGLKNLCMAPSAEGAQTQQEESAHAKPMRMMFTRLPPARERRNDNRAIAS